MHLTGGAFSVISFRRIVVFDLINQFIQQQRTKRPLITTRGKIQHSARTVVWSMSDYPKKGNRPLIETIPVSFLSDVCTLAQVAPSGECLRGNYYYSAHCVDVSV